MIQLGGRMVEYLWAMGLLMAAGFVVTFVAVPLFKRLAVKYGVVSAPGGRRTHGEPTPMLGGMAIFLPLALVFLPFLAFSVVRGTPSVRTDTLQMASLFVGSAWILALGTLDDKYRIGWREKLLGQFGGAFILVLGGHSITTATLPLLGLVDFGWLGVPLFMLAVVAITNAINLTDGIDGLAGGICFFAALTCGVIGLFKGDLFPAAAGFVISGAILGFLVYNFPPASIFMGDGGSMMMGFLLGALAMSSAAAFPGQRLGTSVMIVIPFLPFGIPLFDAMLSVARRWLRGQEIFLGDGDHLHYRVTAKTKNTRLTVIIFYLFSSLLCAITLILVLGPKSELVRTLVLFASIVLCAGAVAGIRLYRFHSLIATLRNRPHFKFLGSYLWYMKHKVQRADSFGSLIQLLESGVTDLAFDHVEVLHNGRTIGKWINPDRVHPESPRVSGEETLNGQYLTVRWARPVHEDNAYNEYLKLTWYRFLAALAFAVEENYKAECQAPAEATAWRV